MASQDVRVVNWEDMERTLVNTFTSVFRDSKKDENSISQANFTATLEQHKQALLENTEKIQNLTRAIQNLSGGIGGGGRPTNATNAPTPQPGQTGAAAQPQPREESSSRLGRMYQKLGDFAQKHPILDRALPYYMGRMANREGGLSEMAGILSPTGGRNAYNAASYAIQSSVDRRVTDPTELGMMAGYQGPGYEGVAGMAGSPFGSYFSGMFAAPSLLFSGGTNPNLIGGAFGAGMSPAQEQGWQTRYRAFTRSLNPFDMLSYQKSLQINQGVAQAGFRNLGETVNVEDAVRDIVMTTSIDVSEAIDALSLSIKRLKMDSKDATEILKQFGPLAKAAGKSVGEFTAESLQVTNRLNALGGRGASTLQAGSIYSGFTGLEGGAVEAFLGGQGMTGIFAANIMGGGAGGQFRNPEDMMKLAMGFYPGMGEGQGANEAAIAQIESMRGLVDRVAAQSGGNKDMAMFMVARMTGQDPYMIQQIYEQGPKVIARSKVSSELTGFAQGFRASVNSKRGSAAVGEEGMAAFGKLQELAEGTVTDWGLSGYKTGEGPLPGLVLARQTQMIDFGEIDLGGRDPDFEEKVEAIYTARMRQQQGMGSQEDVDAAIAAAEGTDAERAASLLMQAGRGNKQAWKALNTDYGVKIGDWVSDAPSANYEKAWKKKSSDLLTQAVKAGAIEESQKKRIEKDIKAGKITSPEAFEDRVQEAMSKEALKQNEVQIALSEEAKRWFNVFNKAANSSQGKFVVVNPPGTENRATPNPGGP